MSVQFLSAAFEAQGLRPTQKLVLLALADRADQLGRCWPSYDDIRHRTGCKRNTISKALDALEEKGLLSRMHRFGSSTVYQLTFVSDHSNSIQRGTINSIQRGTINSIQRGTLTVNEPPIEPSVSECMAYAMENNLNVDVEYFHEYYSGNDWVDAKGNRVKNWKLKMRQWHKRESQAQPKQPEQPKIKGADYWT